MSLLYRGGKEIPSQQKQMTKPPLTELKRAGFNVQEFFPAPFLTTGFHTLPTLLAYI